MNGPRLVWSPIFESLETRFDHGDSLLLAISPFITAEALKRLLSAGRTGPDLRVVARWRASDVRSGVCDLAVYPVLADRGLPLYINPDIHLKLYVFDSDTAFTGSANLTARGLGYSGAGNLEAGTYVDLDRSDWTRIYGLIAGSRQVDDDIYRKFREYAASVPPTPTPIPPVDLLGRPKTFTISSLPAVESPQRLAHLYLSREPGAVSRDEMRRAAHDLAVFGIPDGLSRQDFDVGLGLAFKNAPFVRAFVDWLRSAGSLRFGAVADWLHQQCEDVPLPYRWEVKANTRILYDWLQHFYPEIHWDRPRYSQVIYWQEI